MHAILVAYVSLAVASIALWLAHKGRKPRSLKEIADAGRSGDSPGGANITPDEADQLAFAAIPDAIREHEEHETASGQKYDLKLWRRVIFDRVQKKCAVYGVAVSPHAKAHIERILRG